METYYVPAGGSQHGLYRLHNACPNLQLSVGVPRLSQLQDLSDNLLQVPRRVEGFVGVWVQRFKNVFCTRLDF